MKIEDHVVSLELAQQLKEAGYPQDDSLFYWVKNGAEDENRNVVSIVSYNKDIPMNYPGLIAAPLASELGEQLPIEIIKDGHVLTLCIQRVHIGNKDFPDWGKWGVVYCELPSFNMVLHSEIGSEADARAKMWLYLKKEGLL